MRILFVYWKIILEENVASTLHSMMKWNSLSDPTADLRKAALHEPADITRVEFVAYEAMTRRQVSSIGGSVSAQCSELYPSTTGLDLIKKSDFMEMRLRLPVRRSQGNQYWTRKRFWSASQMIDSDLHCGLITVSFASFFVYSFTPWTLALDTRTSNLPRAQNGPGHHSDDPTMVQKVRRET